MPSCQMPDRMEFERMGDDSPAPVLHLVHESALSLVNASLALCAHPRVSQCSWCLTTYIRCVTWESQQKPVTRTWIKLLPELSYL